MQRPRMQCAERGHPSRRAHNNGPSFRHVRRATRALPAIRAVGGLGRGPAGTAPSRPRPWSDRPFRRTGGPSALAEEARTRAGGGRPTLARVGRRPRMLRRKRSHSNRRALALLDQLRQRLGSHGPSSQKPSSFRLAAIAASSFAASACCSRSWATSRCIFSSNGSPSSSWTSAPT